MSLTKFIDTDLNVLNFFDFSYLAYLKLINRETYEIIKKYYPNNKYNKLTNELIQIKNFVIDNLNNIYIKKTKLLNKCVKANLCLDDIKILHSKKYLPNYKTIACVLKNKDIDFTVLNWMVENNFPKDESAYIYAINNNKIEILQWLLNNKFPNDIFTFSCGRVVGI